MTYTKPGINIAQDTEIPGKKWSTEIDDTYGEYERPNLNAQNSGGGTITCLISKDGKEITKNSSKGDYAVVSCG